MDWKWPNTEVVRVIDGDSFVVRVMRNVDARLEIPPADIGFHGLVGGTQLVSLVVFFQQKIRLNRINAKPISSLSGKAAKQFVVERLFALPFMLVTVGPYKYGDEWMGEVTLTTGENLSDLLVQNELAVYWDGTGPRPDARR